MIKDAVNKIASRWYYVIFVIFAVNLPFIFLTWDTGNFSDDYQFLNLFFTKQIISSPWRMVLDILEPKSDGHFTPVYYLFNTLINLINSSPKVFHFVIILFHIATANVIYLIVQKTHKDNSLALLSGILFSLSYSLCFKALSWNCFHSHATNTFTGVVSLYFTLKYFEDQKWKDLVLLLLFLVLTILNYESGFVFFVIIGVFTIYAFWRKITDGNSVVKIAGVIVLAFSVYGLGTFYFTGKIAPIFFERVNLNTKQELTEKLIKMRNPRLIEDLSKRNDSQNETTLDISEMRSTYAPRTLPVMIIRTADLSLKMINLSILEGLVRPFFDIGNMSIAKKEGLKKRIYPVIKKLFLIGGIVALLVIPILIYIIYKTINSNTFPFLLTLIVLYPVFIIVFNRIDIANSIAIFSSIVFADFILSLVRKSNNFRKLGISILLFLIIMPGVTILNGFDDVYGAMFYSKANLREHSRVFEGINRMIGHYTKKSIVFFHPNNKRIWLEGASADLTCLNTRMFQQEFMESKLAKVFASRSYNELKKQLVLFPNIETILVNSKSEALEYLRKQNIDATKLDVIYVDKEHNFMKMIFSPEI